ncbi:IS66 family insertion sequence hypothetical protein [Sinorhizobium medicae]|nr:IS66 family insertion sequence hypothetical protein [Sinorhizobium medicae]RVJ49107.1 IS66 family insertion sequence hypothetical protein [Sinorhizobium medicae]RVJ66668.1 IS66 family insertion sequence hypothetical protein [Sinorhizobium medicae]RVK07744.1 IS66 family insertion sequence hypothetical protein [Sinorhizobium medicae]RVQ39617.1 IS66 family insertion sequence hypothetical protein [Sinorhizobium medicae]
MSRWSRFGDIVVLAGADVDEVHLQRVIRAVRSA